MNLHEEMEAAKYAAIIAGEKITEIYERYLDGGDGIGIAEKADGSPLTKADSEADFIIVNYLKERFPLYSILSEESKDDLSRLKNRYCWIVDPLDGTKEFINKNGEFTVNIALAYDNRVILGVVYVPVTREMYFASKNNGAYYEKDGKIQAIHATDRTENIRMVMSRSHVAKELDELIKKYDITGFKCIGSSIKGCLIADGSAEVLYRFGETMEWDTAAMQCIAEEAGAIFRQMDDTEMLYNRENSLNVKGFYIINRIENKMTL